MLELITKNYAIIIAAAVTVFGSIVAVIITGLYANYRGRRTNEIEAMGEMRETFMAINDNVTRDYMRKVHELKEERDARALDHEAFNVEREAWRVEHVSLIEQITALGGSAA